MQKTIITLPADSFTPVGLYLKLRDQYAQTLLLESSDYHSRRNSHSYICCDPIAGITVKGMEGEQYVGNTSQKVSLCEKSLTETMQQFIESVAVPAPQLNLEAMESGFFGFTGYSAIPHFESLEFKSSDQDIPDVCYHFYRIVLLFDHFKDELHIIYHHEEGEEVKSPLEQLVALIKNRAFPEFGFERIGPEQSLYTDEEFKGIIEQCIAHCKRGDVFQVVPSRVYEQAFFGDEFTVYRRLRSLNPSPYLFYFDYGSFRIFGSSPEAQLTVDKQVATVNPIAGTYRRTGEDAQDAALARQLLEDPKENAEHTMLVDLARNDLGKEGEHIKVAVFKEVQYYSHVLHLVSRVQANIEGKAPYNIMADTFPAGTLSGAPKYRAMEIINEQEKTGRGLYGGAIGFFDGQDKLNHAIVIRTFVSKGNVLRYQAGAGIVALSEPETEMQEVQNKLSALRQAMAEAEKMGNYESVITR